MLYHFPHLSLSYPEAMILFLGNWVRWVRVIKAIGESVRLDVSEAALEDGELVERAKRGKRENAG